MLYSRKSRRMLVLLAALSLSACNVLQPHKNDQPGHLVDLVPAKLPASVYAPPPQTVVLNDAVDEADAVVKETLPADKASAPGDDALSKNRWVTGKAIFGAAVHPQVTKVSEQPTVASAPVTKIESPVAVEPPPSIRLAHFDFNSDGILSADVDTLTQNAAYLVAHPTVRARIEGHTDARGTQEYNMALGERRAKAVFYFMETQGVQARQMTVISYGKIRPLDESDTEDAWAQNRRVEIVYR